MSEAEINFDVSLDDKYTLETGRVYLTGSQALVRLPIMQRLRDGSAGLNTAGYISGYRGSPLGIYDMALWGAREHLAKHHIHFEPGINEDLAATSVWGSQQTNLLEGAKYDGVFGIWYGKGPGVDRSGDALKHANYNGAAPHGGVLALAGDDHGAKSSTVAHQSDEAFVHFGMPILDPSSVQDLLDFGIYGFAMSRYSGCWVGFKCVTDTVESSSSVSVDPERIQIVIPDDFAMPEGGLNVRWGEWPLMAERKHFTQKLVAAQAFARANGLDRVMLDGPNRRLGIVTRGKAYLDVRQALDELGLDEERCAAIGLSLYKVGMAWPLEPQGIENFARGLDQILVVEEKRALVEDQIAKLLYNLDTRPVLAGKTDEKGAPLVPGVGELSPALVKEALRDWLVQRVNDPAIVSELQPPQVTLLPMVDSSGAALARQPSFCSGCPHNTSTNVPDGSIAMGGIGCHGMAVWLPERRTSTLFQMGGEGAPWIGQAPFTETEHIFQNLGDGTYFHSGLLGVRACVAAGVNITFKILANGAVAMTGGQPIEGEDLAGEVTVPEIARQVWSEGVKRIAVVSDEPDKRYTSEFPKGVTFHHRDQLLKVQRELRDVKGTTVIIYDQTCAAEKRRLRKRKEYPDPPKRVVINSAVCEGCGDCGVQSNCIAIEPLETEFGRKRIINQSSCNKDYSCLKGNCPSFITVLGGSLRKATSGGGASLGDVQKLFDALPLPASADASVPYSILVAGIGGTGVVTVGALLGMAAHLSGKGCSVLDVAGLSQKNGPVTSHVRICDDPDALHSTRIAAGGADLVVGCDMVVTVGDEGIAKFRSGKTSAVVNSHVAPTAQFAQNADLDMSSSVMAEIVRKAAGEERAHLVAATELATALMGDAISSNLFLLGYAFQQGLVPLSLDAIHRAIELNGRSIEQNKQALAWGRLAVHDFAAVEAVAKPLIAAPEAEDLAQDLESIVAVRVRELTVYQSARYAKRYSDFVARVAAAEAAKLEGASELTEAVARYYFKVLAYKDEFEVPRLYSTREFREQISKQFDGQYKLQLNIGPQKLFPRDPETGAVKKIAVSEWGIKIFSLLRHLKFLRGTPFNPFDSPHRKLEREVIAQYERVIDELLAGLNSGNHALAVEIASIPEEIRGFDVVKERHLEIAKEKEAKLLELFRSSQS